MNKSLHSESTCCSENRNNVRTVLPQCKRKGRISVFTDDHEREGAVHATHELKVINGSIKKQKGPQKHQTCTLQKD